jgi:hypothetical protein
MRIRASFIRVALGLSMVFTASFAAAQQCNRPGEHKDCGDGEIPQACPPCKPGGPQWAMPVEVDVTKQLRVEREGSEMTRAINSDREVMKDSAEKYARIVSDSPEN